MEIQGQIIRIIDKTTVIVNLGKNHGITDSCIFSILGDPESIIDPFTKEELGLVTVVKAKVKAVQIHDKFTIASTRWTSTRSIIETSFKVQLGSLVNTEIVDQGELMVNQNDLQPWKAKSEIPVQVGDPVKVEVTTSPVSSQQTDKKNNSDDAKVHDAEDSSGGEVTG